MDERRHAMSEKKYDHYGHPICPKCGWSDTGDSPCGCTLKRAREMDKDKKEKENER